MALGLAILVWTGVAWGGRIGLLVEGDGIWSWVRIGGSLLVGVAASAALLIPRLRVLRRASLMMFVVWTTVVWGRSLMVNWLGTGSLAFKLVHTALAAGFFFLVWWGVEALRRGVAADTARRGRVRSP